MGNVENILYCIVFGCTCLQNLLPPEYDENNFHFAKIYSQGNCISGSIRLLIKNTEFVYLFIHLNISSYKTIFQLTLRLELRN